MNLSHNNPLQTLPQESWTTLQTEEICKKLDISQEKVNFVLKQNMAQIRRTQPESTIELNKELKLLTSEYGTRQAIPEHVMEEAVRFVLEKFSQLGVKEIRAAYRAWASDQIEVENAEIYGGVFNIRQLGSVLSGWVVYRNRIIAAYERQKSNDEIERKAAERAEKWKTDFEVNFPLEIEALKKTAESWKDVPAYFYDAIQKRWPIKFKPGEAAAIMKEAEQVADLDIEKAKSEALADISKRIEFNAVQSSKVERAKTIAQKMAVFNKVIKQK